MGTVIGFVVSMVLFGGYFRVMKKSRLFVVLYSVLMASFEFFAFIFCIDLNWWNVLILPFGTLLITFICFFIAPLSPNNVDVVTDSVMSELPNYYENYDSFKKGVTGLKNLSDSTQKNCEVRLYATWGFDLDNSENKKNDKKDIRVRTGYFIYWFICKTQRYVSNGGACAWL